MNRVPEPMSALEAPPRERESALLDSALAGDRRAFGELVQLHQGRSLALATGIVGSREEALDLVQEACLKSWKALRTFVPGMPFFPWYYRILRNACIQHLRRRKVRRSVSLQGVDTEGEGFAHQFEDRDTPRPEEIFERDERSARLSEALVRLGSADAEILMLKHFQGLSYKQIAETLQIPVGTVMSRLHAARQRLRSLLPELA
ncbi:MAG TPA: sigma-70 family RNA polymerase sigma factor [Planctomycetota bacterium]